MKNFARLARFAWPYRVRFGVSLVCATMVALLWFGNFASIYYFLQIVLKSQNCQKWVAEEIVASRQALDEADARLAELELVADRHAGGTLRSPEFKAYFARVEAQAHAEADRLVELHRTIDRAGPAEMAVGVDPKDEAELARQERLVRTTEARLDELKKGRELALDGTEALAKRRETLVHDRADARWWLASYRRIQPWVQRYLPDDGYRTLLLLLCAVLLAVALKGVFLFGQEVLVADIMQLTLFDIRNLFFRRTIALDLASFSEQGSSELMARFTNDMDSFSQGLNTLLSKVIREPLRIITTLGGAFWFNWRLTCLTLIIVPISAVTTYRVGKIMKRAVRRSLESMSSIYKILQETFQGIKVVKAFTRERHERHRFHRETKELYRKCVRVAKIDAMSDPVLEMLSFSMISIAVLAGTYLVLRHTKFVDLGLFQLQLASEPMAIEDLFTLYAMLGGISDPIRKLANVHSKIQRAAAASDRICTLMDRQPKVIDRPAAPRLPRHRRAIEFRAVEFSYNGLDPVLRGLDLEVRHGETIALVGPNGCGKSTLMNLLPRFWDVDAGAILVDGHDLREIQIRSLRSQIGLVAQETVLFQGTLFDNLAYGNLHASRAEVEAAARRAYAHGFIEALPAGYDTPIGEGGLTLSGGQRQRIALARAMLRDPAILILDEATSAVDIQDEALIRKAIEEFSRGRTTFLITHSLGSLQFADRIALMHAGRIEAVGTEAELRRSSALFRRLHEIHFQRESA